MEGRKFGRPELVPRIKEDSNYIESQQLRTSMKESSHKLNQSNVRGSLFFFLSLDSVQFALGGNHKLTTY
jgi:hypothetical protein